MNHILDIHTHNINAGSGAVISVGVDEFAPCEGCCYSVGVHPWHIPDDVPAIMRQLEIVAAHPQVVALGETGMDSLRGASIDVQESLFRQHIALAALMSKPVVAHMVRTSQQLVRAWREMSPAGIALVVHCMRGNENVARQLVEAGCYLSFGARYNPAALLATPLNRILAETDEAPLPITGVVKAMASTLNINAGALTSVLQENAARALGRM